MVESALMTSAPSGARPKLVCTRMPVPLITGRMREARRSCRPERMRASTASTSGMAFCDRSAFSSRRTTSTTIGRGSPVSPSDCSTLSTEGIARRRDAFHAEMREVDRTVPEQVRSEDWRRG